MPVSNPAIETKRANFPEGFSLPPVEYQPMPFMDEYLYEMGVNDKSHDYVRKVKVGLAYFATFCSKINVAHPGQVERAHLLQFQGWLGQQGWKKSYQIQQLKYIRAWFNWMEEVRYNPENPWYRIRVGRVEKVPNPLSDDELATLFEAHRQDAFKLPPFRYHRREVILTLLYAWGLRIHELHALNTANMDVRLDFVRCINKGGTSKTLPYGPALKSVYLRWASVRSKYAQVGEDALIIDDTGSRLSIQRTRAIVVDLGARCGMDIHPHQLRDTCGTHLLDSDMELERVQRILGHSTVNQTLAYSRVNDRKVKEAHERAMTPRLQVLLPDVPF